MTSSSQQWAWIAHRRTPARLAQSHAQRRPHHGLPREATSGYLGPLTWSRLRDSSGSTLSSARQSPPSSAAHSTHLSAQHRHGRLA
eukprot:6196152-Pleurochrysis_carterae.AAC.3